MLSSDNLSTLHISYNSICFPSYIKLLFDVKVFVEKLALT
ncbi:8536_t:CDS:2 [Racocetra fulgida]|uniref:8536_t:CDS:1 n=1 Tax=Racocetra fulgida TaxID=60492 RepID=A0A9N8VQS2_9GLOM|nr:8536_t:CDS:2 [Racocetra fulgida]